MAKLEVIVAPSALERMVAGNPSDEERLAIRTLLGDLTEDPLQGYEIAFIVPKMYRIDCGRFRIHYRFDKAHLRVAFIGVY